MCWYSALSALAIVVTMAASLEATEIFQYTDANGTMVFVDDLDKVPREYVGQTRQKHLSLTEVQSTRAETTPVIMSDDMIYVPVTVSYRGISIRTLFLLDTGASVTAISAVLAERLGIRNVDTEPLVTRLADGRTIPSRHAVLTALSAEPKTWRNIDVAIIPVSGPALPFDGWLGMNVIGKSRHQLNVDSRMIQWTE